MKLKTAYLFLAHRAMLILAFSVLAGCAATVAPTAPGASAAATHVTLPLATAWFEGTLVRYISLDTSDAAMAKAKNMNFVPRLALALLEGAAVSGKRSVLERAYIFPDDSQFNVFASVPQPVGYASTDTAYSPLWHLYAVTWQPGRVRRELRSEEQVLEAVERGDVKVMATQIVTNCPVLQTERGGLLSAAQLHLSR